MIAFKTGYHFSFIIRQVVYRIEDTLYISIIPSANLRIKLCRPDLAYIALSGIARNLGQQITL